MRDMRYIKKPVIKLGRVRRGAERQPRLWGDSGQVRGQYSARAQRVVVKVKQSYNNCAGTWREHGRYLQRDNARFGEAFSRSEDSVDLPLTLNSWQDEGDEKLHKIIVSPEYADRIDLKEHTRELMQQVESDLARDIEWVAVIHKNTDYSHVHVALRGKDREGQPLDVESYLGSSLRDRCRDQVTKELGPRLYPEILQRRETELYAERLTDIDRGLLWKADENSFVRIWQRPVAEWQRAKTNEQERIRLSFLANLGLAEKISREVWRLSPDLRESLKRLALRDQLVKEQVPGWEFVRTLRASGVVRRRLELGETLTGRVVGTDICDPFGDRQFMLIEGTDGKTYHLNQPRGATDGRIAAGQVVTLTRRAANLEDEKTGKPTEREFTAVEVHADWRHSLVLDCEAVASLQKTPPRSKASLRRIGFGREWSMAVAERAAELKAKDFDAEDRWWKSKLEKLRFAERSPDVQVWDPRSYIVLEREGDEAASDIEAPDSANRTIVGEVLCIGEGRVLIRDIRDGQGYVVTLADVGLNWPPNVGTMLAVSAKPLPRTEIRPTDYRIAGLIEEHGTLSEYSLKEAEKTYVLARANTWVRWGVLVQDDAGGYRLAGDSQKLSKDKILELMESRLTEIREEITEELKKQPAWAKLLSQDNLSASPESFVMLDRLLRDVGPLGPGCTNNWLSRALKWRHELWEKRGVALDRDFERNARTWLRDRMLPTVLREGERVTGRIVDLSAAEGQYLSVECSDGKVQHFRISERIREKIDTGRLDVGDVITLSGKSFYAERAKTDRRVHYLDVLRYFDWSTSGELLRAAVEPSTAVEPGLDEETFGAEWRKRVAERRGRLGRLVGLELVETKLRLGEELQGKVVDTSINDRTLFLLHGSDGKLHLVYQSRRMREAVSRDELKPGDIVRLSGRELEIDGKRITYTDFRIRGKSREDWRQDLLPPGARVSELESGQPVSGTIVSIRERADSSGPSCIIVKDPGGANHYLKTTRGIGRAIVDGVLQVGDEVTISAREFTRDGKVKYFADVHHHNVREKVLGENEELFGRLLSQELYRDRFILLDTPEGKAYLHVSRSVKNQIKSRRIREGDVILFTSKTRRDDQEQSESPKTLVGTLLRQWKESEEFDRFVVQHLQREQTDEGLTIKRGSFAAEWQAAVRARERELLAAGIDWSANWHEQLQKHREREHLGELRRPPVLSDIRPRDLRDIQRLESLFLQAVDAGWLTRSEANALNFVSAAVKATKSRGDQVRTFQDIVKTNDWKEIHQQEEDRARQMLAAYRERIGDIFIEREGVEKVRASERESQSMHAEIR